jgi:hypothetical protein
MIYQTQAVNARVDMTLLFVLSKFDSVLQHLPRFLAHLWPYAMYLLVGLRLSVKGLVLSFAAGDVVFLALKRIEAVFQIRLHPGC